MSDSHRPPLARNPRYAVAPEPLQLDRHVGVWSGYDRTMRRAIVIRATRADLAPEDARRARSELAREAALQARLDHPGVIPVFDQFEEPARGSLPARLCVTLKRVQADTLGTVLAGLRQTWRGRHSEWSASDDYHDLIEQFLAACQTVAAAHETGVMHQLLSPDTILIGRFGEVLVTGWKRSAPGSPADDVRALGQILALVGAVPLPDATSPDLSALPVGLADVVEACGACGARQCEHTGGGGIRSATDLCDAIQHAVIEHASAIGFNRELYDRMYRQRDRSVFDDMLHPDCRIHFRLGDAESLDVAAYRATTEAFMTAFPDVRFEFDQTFANGRAMVAFAGSYCGTHRGPLFGLPATERTFRVDGASLLVVHGRRMLHSFTVFDVLGMYRQLGLIELLPVQLPEMPDWSNRMERADLPAADGYPEQQKH